ncbi:hypothetical protein O6H91_Y115800 [Diphasiastrum complanatum]|nr:hypothetical protein O6H91_Y115800 [Diphasiastrum complanatum]
MAVRVRPPSTKASSQTQYRLLLPGYNICLFWRCAKEENFCSLPCPFTILIFCGQIPVLLSIYFFCGSLQNQNIITLWMYSFLQAIFGTKYTPKRLKQIYQVLSFGLRRLW